MMDLIQASRPVFLTPDDVSGIADCFSESVGDFLGVSQNEQVSSSFGEIHNALEVQIRSLKNFLLFAMRSGAAVVELDDLLLQIQPLAITAAGVFVTSDTSFRKWSELVESNCATLRRMIASPQLFQACTRVLRSAKPDIIHPEMDRDDDDDVLKNVLDSLVSLLWDVLRSEACDHPAFGKDQLKLLYERLRLSRGALKQQPDGKIRDHIRFLVCDAGVLICSLNYQTDDELVDPGLLSDLLQASDGLVHEAQPSGGNELMVGGSTDISEDIKEEGEEGEGLKEIATQASKTALQDVGVGVGFKGEELTSLLDQLSGGISKHLRMVAISGMAGIGKTTLALQLFNKASVMFHFQAFAWCTISQVLDKKKVFLELLNKIHPSPSYSNMAEDDLANKLRRNLKGKKYLIFLDDVWTNEAWNDLATSFPDDSTQSRIILTSRYNSIAPRDLLVNGESHSLRLRDDRECLQILESKVFPEKGWPLELTKFGMEIAAKCKGLPLIATIVAGLLSSTKQDDWKKILEDLSTGVVSTAKQCNNALELSYNHLPGELRPCFLYFGAYPEDKLVHVRRLIQLWMAEGFVKNESLKRIEDVARGYLNVLIERNLVMIAKKRSIGGAKTCVVHDVLHDFCVKRAKQESFFHLLLQRYDHLSNYNESYSLQRLCIHSELGHFMKSKLFCPCAQSLMLFIQEQEYAYFFNMSFIVQIFKLVKVLDLGEIFLTTEIPSEMQLLTRLKYLSFQCKVGDIPSWIGNLSSLETFIVVILWTPKYMSLPDSFWNLRELKYFHIICPGGIRLPIKNLENSLVLSKLETLVGVVFNSGSMKKQMRKFPNIRRLKCRVEHALESTEESIKIVISDSLSHLESLTIRMSGKFTGEFRFLENLGKLTLRDFKLLRDEIEVIGNIPNLEVLKLVDVSFSEGTLDMEEGEFSKLRILRLSDNRGSLKRWTTSDEQLLSLQKLVLHGCVDLEEMPSCLEAISTLEKIKVSECSDFVENFVKNIEKVCNDFGNPIIVHTTIRKGVAMLNAWLAKHRPRAADASL